ncbi:hypothetical protein NXX40_08745 [Parabacteroides distasonis]|nr:hypothetical protein [Parabacteroides distasonis]
MVAIILVTYLDLVKGYGMSSLEKGGLFPVWLLFFVMGVYLGNRKERAYRLWPWLFVMGIGLFLSFLETKWLYPLYHMGYGIKASAHLYSLAVIMVLFSEKTQRKFTSFGLWFRLLVLVGTDLVWDIPYPLLFYHGIESLALSLGLVLTDIRSVGSLLMPCIWRTKSLAIGGSQGRILKGLE